MNQRRRVVKPSSAESGRPGPQPELSGRDQEEQEEVAMPSRPRQQKKSARGSRRLGAMDAAMLFVDVATQR